MGVFFLNSSLHYLPKWLNQLVFPLSSEFPTDLAGILPLLRHMEGILPVSAPHTGLGGAPDLPPHCRWDGPGSPWPFWPWLCREGVRHDGARARFQKSGSTAFAVGGGGAVIIYNQFPCWAAPSLGLWPGQPGFLGLLLPVAFLSCQVLHYTLSSVGRNPRGFHTLPFLRSCSLQSVFLNVPSFQGLAICFT